MGYGLGLCATELQYIARLGIESRQRAHRRLGVRAHRCHARRSALALLPSCPALPGVPPDPNYVFKIPEYEQYLHADAEKHLRETRDELVSKNVKVRTQVGHGSAAEEIVLIAKTEGADLIVISTHGSTGFERWVFGSVAEKVVRLAECPVLTVRQKETA